MGGLVMSAADEAYARLMAAQQRGMTDAERAELKAQAERESEAARIRRRLPKVY